MAVLDWVRRCRNSQSIPIRRTGDRPAAAQWSGESEQPIESWYSLEHPFPGVSDLTRGGDAIALDMSEDEGAVEVWAELPGSDRKDIEVWLDQTQLVIRGKKGPGDEKKNGKQFLTRERVLGAVERSIRLPAGLDENRAEAQYFNGIVRVSIPKREGAKKLLPQGSDERDERSPGDMLLPSTVYKLDLAELRYSLENIKTRATELATDVRRELTAEVVDLSRRADALEQKIAELRAMGEKVGSSFQESVEQAWRDLKDRVDNLRKLTERRVDESKKDKHSSQ